jgi:hypothetical protein
MTMRQKPLGTILSAAVRIALKQKAAATATAFSSALLDCGPERQSISGDHRKCSICLFFTQLLTQDLLPFLLKLL